MFRSALLATSGGFLLLFSVLAGCSAEVDPELDDATGETTGETTETPIINGSRASDYQEAVLVDMLRGGRQAAICSGSLIAPRVVLTAGHCVVGFNGFRITAPYANRQTSTASRSAVYDWRDNGRGTVDPNLHDVGLIYLDREIRLTRYPTLATSKLADGTAVVNVGRIDNGRASSTDLFVSPPVTVSDGRRSGFPFSYSSRMTIQSGDSGGPVFTQNTRVIAAVNSGAGGNTQVLARIDFPYLVDFIQRGIAANGGSGNTGGGGGGGTDAGTGGGGGGGTACTGTPESEPNDTYQRPNALGAAACGALSTATDQDWFSWSVAAGTVNYSVKVAAAGDAKIDMWKLVNGSYTKIANTSPTEITRTSSNAGTYVLAISSPSGTTQNYRLTLTR
jgi:V8-like Glu-specific endopeptidase